MHILIPTPSTCSNPIVSSTHDNRTRIVESTYSRYSASKTTNDAASSQQWSTCKTEKSTEIFPELFGIFQCKIEVFVTKLYPMTV